MSEQRTIEFSVTDHLGYDEIREAIVRECHRCGIVRPRNVNVTDHTLYHRRYVTITGDWEPSPRKLSHSMVVTKRMKKLLEEKAKWN